MTPVCYIKCVFSSCTEREHGLLKHKLEYIIYFKDCSPSLNLSIQYT